MSEAEPDPDRTGPSRWWYVAAVLPFLLSLVPASVLGRAAADQVGVHLDVGGDRTVEIRGHNRAVYAASRMLSLRMRCSLRSADGTTVRLDEAARNAQTTQDGATWYRAAPLPPGLDAGTYALRCHVDHRTVSPTSLAVSRSPRWGRAVLLLVAAFGISVSAAVLGALVVVLVFSMRRRRRAGGPPRTGPLTLDD